MAQQEFFDQIEAFLDGTLAPEAQTRFEQGLQSDTALAEEVSLAKETRQLLLLATQQSYKEKLQAVDAEMEAQKTRVIRPLWQRTWVQAAAAAVLILLISSVLLIRGGSSASSLGQEAFTPYMDMISYKGSPSDAADSLLLSAMYAYNTGAYETALTELQQILDAQPTHVPARFYQAQSYLALEKPLPALAILEQLPAEGALAEATQWYSALALLMQENETEGRVLLEEMAEDPSHGFQLKAQDLLEQL